MFKLNKKLHSKCHVTDKVPWQMIFFSAGIIFLHFLGDEIFHLFIYDKAAIIRGQIWRLMTGHFVHCNIQHLFWDIFAFMILGAVVEIKSSKHFIFGLFFSCSLISAWLFLFEPNITTYCGLSGALNGMLVLASVVKWRETDSKIYFLVLLATLLKIIFEWINQQTIFTTLSLQAVPSSHAAGYISGIIYLFFVNPFLVKKRF